MISITEPGELDIIALPKNAVKKRVIRIVSMFFANADGNTKTVNKLMETM